MSGPKSGFEAILLFGAVEADDVRTAKKLIHGNIWAQTAIENVRSLAMLNAFIDEGIDPKSAFRPLFERLRPKMNVRSASEWGQLVIRHSQPDESPVLRDWIEYCMVNGWGLEHIPYDVDMTRSFFLASGSPYKLDLSKSKTNFKYLFSLVNSVFPENDFWEYVKTQHDNTLFIKAVVEQYGLIFFKHVIRSGIPYEIFDKKYGSDANFLFDVKKEMTKDPKILNDFFFNICTGRNVVVIKRLLVLTSFDVATLNEGLRLFLLTEKEFQKDLDRRHEHILPFLQLGAQFDDFQNTSSKFFTFEILKVLLNAMDEERKKNIRSELVSYTDKILGGKIAYLLNNQ